MRHTYKCWVCNKPAHYDRPQPRSRKKICSWECEREERVKIYLQVHGGRIPRDFIERHLNVGRLVKLKIKETHSSIKAFELDNGMSTGAVSNILSLTDYGRHFKFQKRLFALAKSLGIDLSEFEEVAV